MFGPRKRLAVVAFSLGVLLIVAAATLGSVEFAVVVMGAVLLVGLIGVAYLVVELDRRRRRSDAERSREVAHAVTAAQHDEQVARERLAGEMSRESARAATAAEELRSDLDRGLGELTRSVASVERTVHRDLLDLFAQIEALLALQQELQLDRPLPSTRGWAASPDLLLWCWRHVRDRSPVSILECGSGTSTVVLAAACRRNGHGRVIALEHDAGYAEETRRLLEDHELSGWAEVRTAPLTERPGEDRPWYRLDAVPDGPIDLVIIDGPPGGVDHLARLPAVEVLHPLLADDAVVVLDDAKRSGERKVVERWLEEHPEMELQELPHEKGTAVLRRRA